MSCKHRPHDDMHCVFCGKCRCQRCVDERKLAEYKKPPETCMHDTWLQVEGKFDEHNISVRCARCDTPGEVYYPCT